MKKRRLMPGVATTNTLPSRRLSKQKFAEENVRKQLVHTDDTILSETVIKSANSYLQILSYFCSSNYFAHSKIDEPVKTFRKAAAFA